VGGASVGDAVVSASFGAATLVDALVSGWRGE
jgi:hypothetical protein